MTAIVWLHIADGFAIGADGRRALDGVVHSETTQKVYGISVAQFKLAYGWTGMTGAQRADGTTFTFKDLTDFIFLTDSVDQARTFAELMDKFADSLHLLLRMFIGPAAIKQLNSEIARAVFLCYDSHIPHSADVYIEHDGTSVLRPRIEYGPAAPVNFNVLTGSERVYKEMEDRLKVRPDSLTEASGLIREYIEECKKHQETDADCAGIGGHVHIGWLRPSGFFWFCQPTPQSQTYSSLCIKDPRLPP